MGKNLYLTATEARSGKSAVSLGVMEILQRRTERVGFFRPVISGVNGSREKDHDIHLISPYFKLDAPYEEMYGYRAGIETSGVGVRLIEIPDSGNIWSF